jgi:hypothetical protein
MRNSSTESDRRYRKAVEFGQNGVGRLCPDERFGTIVVLSEVGVDSGLQVGRRAKDTATDALSGHLGNRVDHLAGATLVESDGARAGPMSHDPNGTLAAAQPSTQ